MIPTIRTLPRPPGIVILAAGRSRRFGRPKAQARLHGRTLWQHLQALLRPFSRQCIFVVTAPRSPLRSAALANGWRCITNPDCDQGLSTSVVRGVRAGRFQPALLILPLDLPLLSTGDLLRFLDRWRLARRDVVARRLEGGPAIPLILPRRLYGLALQLHGDAGLRSLLSARTGGQIHLLDLPRAALDVDSPADLKHLRRQHRFRTRNR
ncbi:MAG: NTP transferase domain-containing protein [Proteobacteria bacterium]|nr:NTP transferase domain-containing protein [Pseudomonadota bacterium]